MSGKPSTTEEEWRIFSSWKSWKETQGDEEEDDNPMERVPNPAHCPRSYCEVVAAGPCKVHKEKAHHPQPKAHHPQPKAHHPQQKAHHPQPKAHHPQQKAHHPQQKAHHPQQKAHHPQQKAHHPQPKAEKTVMVKGQKVKEVFPPGDPFATSVFDKAGDPFATSVLGKGGSQNCCTPGPSRVVKAKKEVQEKAILRLPSGHGWSGPNPAGGVPRENWDAHMTQQMNQTRRFEEVKGPTPMDPLIDQIVKNIQESKNDSRLFGCYRLFPK